MNPTIAAVPGLTAKPAAAPAKAKRKKVSMLWAVPAVALIALGSLAAFRPWGNGGGNGVIGQFHAVVPMDLEVKIAKDGELQAISYIDIKSEVEGVTQIIELIKEGSTVNKGDVLIRLDSSHLVTRLENLEMDLRRAESALKQSMDLKAIQENQNAASEENAKVQLNLAKLELDQYEKGTHPQELQNARTALDMAHLNLKNKEEDLDQTNKLYARGFVTAADVKKEQLAVTTARNDVAKAETALKVLKEYSNKIRMASLTSQVLQAEQSMYRVMRSNTTYMNSRLADLAEKEQAVDLLKRQKEKLTTQIEACTITAPEGGLVIYASSIERNLREPVQEGSSVRQSQWLIRLPDVRAMKAVLKVQESQKAKLDDGKGQRALVKILGLSEPVGATLTKVSVLADSSSRWWNPDLKEYPIELTLDETPPGLKPGTGVQAEIFIDRLYGVLGVPLVSIYSVGQDSYVFVKESQTVAPRKVSVAASNETHIQVVDGLKENEEVLLLEPGQGRALLEKAGIKVADPTTRPSNKERDKALDRRPEQQMGEMQANGKPDGAGAEASKDGDAKSAGGKTGGDRVAGAEAGRGGREGRNRRGAKPAETKSASLQATE